MAQGSATVRTGPGFVGLGFLVSIVFVILHFAGVGAFATMSWFWLLSPLWIGFLITVGLFILGLLIVALVAIGAAIFGRNQ